jgi:hypothetical protein
MASNFKEYSMSVNSLFKVKVLLLAPLVYVFFTSIFVFADRSAELWNSHIVSASGAVILTVISMMQILIFLRVSSLSTKTNRVIREIQNLKTSNKGIQSKKLSTSEEILVKIEALRADNSYTSDEILINIEALRSVLNALNLQNLDEQNPQLKAAP